jgi:hypothetical protein
MGRNKPRQKITLADALDRTRWDFERGKDRKALLNPAGSVFSKLPWEIEPRYLGPAPIAEMEAEVDVVHDTENTADVDTQPIEPLDE